jgi:hypothetical protein
MFTCVKLYRRALKHGTATQLGLGQAQPAPRCRHINNFLHHMGY